MSYFGEAFQAGWTVLQGMWVTLKEFFNPPITLQYPYERPKLPEGSRGLPVQLTDLTTGKYKCTACGICVRACPVGCIALDAVTNPETKKKEVGSYSIDMSQCMVCGLCVEACPFDALAMSGHFEMADYNVDNLLYNFDKLLELGKPYSKAEPPKPEKPATPAAAAKPVAAAAAAAASAPVAVSKAAAPTPAGEKEVGQ